MSGSIGAGGAGAPTLLLVPTALELRELARLGGFPSALARVETCGFGPIAAAASTAALLCAARPSRVLLVGIAGSYDLRVHPVGSATTFTSVAIDGLETRGFEQAPGVGERIELRGWSPEPVADPERNGLVTVWAPSGSVERALERRARHEEASAEDMEGFGVAFACALAGVPLAIVRGISNAAGDLEHGRLRIAEALSAARAVAIELLGADVRSTPR